MFSSTVETYRFMKHFIDGSISNIKISSGVKIPTYIFPWKCKHIKCILRYIFRWEISEVMLSPYRRLPQHRPQLFRFNTFINYDKRLARWLKVRSYEYEDLHSCIIEWFPRFIFRTLTFIKTVTYNSMSIIHHAIELGMPEYTQT